MKKILISSLIMMAAAIVNAQTGMPKELTCTERAFNFSFSLGTKWKLSTPKMGPTEVAKEEYAYFPAWSLKHNNLKPGAPLVPLVEMPLNINFVNYQGSRQFSKTLFDFKSFNLINQPLYLLTGNIISPSLNYGILWPAATVISSSNIR